MVHGVGGKESVLDRVGEDAAEQPENAVHGGVFVAAGVKFGSPLLDVVAVSVTQGGVAVARPDVLGDQVSVVLDSELVDIERWPPPCQPLVECHVSQDRVVERASPLIDLDLTGPMLRGLRRREPTLGADCPVALR